MKCPLTSSNPMEYCRTCDGGSLARKNAGSISCTAGSRLDESGRGGRAAREQDGRVHRCAHGRSEASYSSRVVRGLGWDENG